MTAAARWRGGSHNSHERNATQVWVHRALLADKRRTTNPAEATLFRELGVQQCELDSLVEEWTKVILENLTDPTVKENIELLADPKGKEAVEQFLESKALPDPVPPAFVQALQEALEGLEKVAVADADLHAALIKGGVPCTIEDLKGRFDGYLAQITKGKDASRVRIVIE